MNDVTEQYVAVLEGSPANVGPRKTVVMGYTMTLYPAWPVRTCPAGA
jgi:hypothetical protein